MERFRQTRERRRREREQEEASGRSRQTRMEDFFRVTRKRKQVSLVTTATLQHTLLPS